ncbi:hypothetical protein NN561_014495 [Cricetulus griseus]
MGPAGRRRDVARARTRCAPTSPGMGTFPQRPEDQSGPQRLAYLRGGRIAGIKGLLGQADWITRLREEEEEVRRVPAAPWAGASPIPGTHGLSAASCGRRGHTELAEGGGQGNVPSASV